MVREWLEKGLWCGRLSRRCWNRGWSLGRLNGRNPDGLMLEMLDMLGRRLSSLVRILRARMLALVDLVRRLMWRQSVCWIVDGDGLVKDHLRRRRPRHWTGPIGDSAVAQVWEIVGRHKWSLRHRHLCGRGS